MHVNNQYVTINPPILGDDTSNKSHGFTDSIFTLASSEYIKQKSVQLLCSLTQQGMVSAAESESH